MNNSFSRPSLGINQLALFNASNEMAQNASLRVDFMSQPQSVLSKYGLNVSETLHDKELNYQQTSEVCTFLVGACAVFLVAGAIVGVGLLIVTAGVAGGVALAAGECWVEFGGCNTFHQTPNLQYQGLV
jgi:hypothetical protein